MYLEPWHADIFDFLDLKKNHGKEEMRARDLFYAMWVPDLFMARVQEDGTLDLNVSATECPHLFDTYGDEFERLYDQVTKKLQEKGEKQSKHETFGRRSWNLKSKQGPRTCCIKTQQTANLTRRI